MKAVILLAGIGTRLLPLTLDQPKCLLPIGDSTILKHMITKLLNNNVTSFVIVCGHMEEIIQGYIRGNFPKLNVVFVTNDKYSTTNTGYSLLMARGQLEEESFIKLDGDVVFDEDIVRSLMKLDSGISYVCTDATSIDEEVIKIVLDQNGQISAIGNTLPVEMAVGESIGIERISKSASAALFKSLALSMLHLKNHQDYYEVSYDKIIKSGEKFRSLDITGLDWVEMDNAEDYAQAQKFFAQPE